MSSAVIFAYIANNAGPLAAVGISSAECTDDGMSGLYARMHNCDYACTALKLHAYMIVMHADNVC
jgi:hypothetical protein